MMTYIKVKNRHNFFTITTTSKFLPEPAPNEWTVCHYDADGEPWSWYRKATDQEVEEWMEWGYQFGDWIEG
jgi:hypothetical protein